MHMSVRHPMSIVLIAAVCSALFAGRAISGPWLPAPGEYSTELRGSLFSADDFHNRLGHREQFATGGVLQQRTALSYTEFGWKKNVSAVLGIPAVSVTRRSGTGAPNNTQTGLSDLKFGLRFKLADGPTALAFEVDYGAPLGYDHNVRLTSAQLRAADTTFARGLTGGDSANAVRQSAPPNLGLGQQEVTAMLLWGAEIRPLKGFIQLAHGYRHLGREVSGQALLGADLGIWFFPRVMMAGRYQGAIQVGHGTTSADAIEEHLVGPLLLYRVDDQLDVYAGFMSTATGRNTVHADRYYVGISMKQTGLNRLQGFLGGTKRP